jgi:PAS domain S-box-containing protein
VGTRRNTGRGLNWMGEFANSALEVRFREAMHNDWRGQIKVVCIICVLIALGMGISDLMALGIGADWWRVMGFRTVMAVALVFPIVAVSRDVGPTTLDRVLFISLLVFVALSFPLSQFRIVHFTLFLVPVVILLFVPYIFMPTRLIYSLTIGAGLSIGYLTWVLVLGQRSAGEVTAMAILIVLCNLIGIISERRRQVADRRHFALTDDLSHSVDRLDQELVDCTYTEAAFRNSEERHRRLVELSPDGIIVIDDGSIVFANPSAARMLGFDGTDDLMGRDIASFLDDEDQAVADDRRRSVLANGVSMPVIKQKWFRADGQELFADSSGTLIPWQHGNAILGVFRDVTERKKVERMKSDFISTVSHELRTPLTSIKGALGLMAGGAVGDLPEQAGSMIDIAYKNSDRLVRLINDLLDMEKIESGQMEYSMGTVDVMDLVR